MSAILLVWQGQMQGHRVTGRRQQAKSHWCCKQPVRHKVQVHTHQSHLLNAAVFVCTCCCHCPVNAGDDTRSGFTATVTCRCC